MAPTVSGREANEGCQLKGSSSEPLVNFYLFQAKKTHSKERKRIANSRLEHPSFPLWPSVKFFGFNIFEQPRLYRGEKLTKRTKELARMAFHFSFNPKRKMNRRWTLMKRFLTTDGRRWTQMKRNLNEEGRKVGGSVAAAPLGGSVLR